MHFKYALAFGLFLVIPRPSYSQSGCTDPDATNYNPSAIVNDGSCVYPVTHYTPALRAVLSPALKESSGLIWTDGKLWTHNDSGNPPDIYSIDTADGHTLQRVVVDNYPNVDWEDITADSNYIYIGDHGNNKGSRTDLKVLKVAKADITGDSVVHVNAQAISFSYTDQTSFLPSTTNNFDCEALISIKDSLYLFTKDRGDLETRVYKMPKTPGTYALTPYTSYNVAGLITGADYNLATKEVVLIGYLSGHINSFLWFLNDYSGDMFFSGNKRRIEIGSGREWQTEAVAYLSYDRLFISCESTDSIDASLYTGQKTFVHTGVINSTAKTAYTIDPNPTYGLLYVNNPGPSVSYNVLNMTGQVVAHGNLNNGNNKIDVSKMQPANYVLELIDQDGYRTIKRFTKQ